MLCARSSSCCRNGGGIAVRKADRARFPGLGVWNCFPGRETFLFFDFDRSKNCLLALSSRDGGILLGGSFMRRVCQFNFIRKFTSRPEICQCRPSIFRKRGHARFPILVHGMVVGRERRLHFHGRISKIPRRERVLVHGHNFQTVSVVGTLKVWA